MLSLRMSIFRSPLSRMVFIDTDRIPLHINFKLRQRARRAPTHRHMSCNTGPCLPVNMGSGTATYTVAQKLSYKIVELLKTSFLKRCKSLSVLMTLVKLERCLAALESAHTIKPAKRTAA
jgi:hypothetical protein